MSSSEHPTQFLPSTAIRFPIPLPPLNIAPLAGRWGFYKIGLGSHICKGSLRQSIHALARQLCPCICAPRSLPTLKKTPSSCRCSLPVTAFLLFWKKKKKYYLINFWHFIRIYDKLSYIWTDKMAELWKNYLSSGCWMSSKRFCRTWSMTAN